MQAQAGSSLCPQREHERALHLASQPDLSSPGSSAPGRRHLRAWGMAAALWCLSGPSKSNNDSWLCHTAVDRCYTSGETAFSSSCPRNCCDTHTVRLRESQPGLQNNLHDRPSCTCPALFGFGLHTWCIDHYPSPLQGLALDREVGPQFQHAQKPPLPPHIHAHPLSTPSSFFHNLPVSVEQHLGLAT